MSNYTTSNYLQRRQLSECSMLRKMDTSPIVLDFADLGSCNLRDLDRAKQMLLSAVMRSGPNRLDVFLNVQQGGASFVGILVGADAQARSQGGQLRLQAVTPNIREVITLCGLERLIASTV